MTPEEKSKMIAFVQEVLDSTTTAYNDSESSIGYCVCCGQSELREHEPDCIKIKAEILLKELKEEKVT